MAVNTVLLDFTVEPSQVKSNNQITTILYKIETIIRDFCMNGLKLTSNSVTVDGGAINLYTDDVGTLITVRVYVQGLITVTIEYYKGENQEPLLSFETNHKLRDALVSALPEIKKNQAYPIIKRGLFSRYYPSADERLLEYDIDDVVFEEQSPFQKIQIVHSKSLGNMLVLDELQNMSEADLVYTETLMQRGKEDYKNKEIVILGGGDGALLYELLKESPRHVTMLEIDEIVMRACSKYMRSICGDVLDRMSAPNYDIVVGDCTKSLEQYVAEGRKFDYVFGDLTDIPISDTPSGEVWDFIMHILEMSFKVLKPNGKFMTHGNGASCTEALKMYESQLMKLNPPVVINKTTAFIPSFLEHWVFYQITFAEEA